MAVFTAIPDTDLDANSPITENLMLALRDNAVAIAEGDATAPNISNNAFADNSINGAKLINSSVSQAKISYSYPSTSGSITATGGTYTTFTQVGLFITTYSTTLGDLTRIEMYVNGAWRTATTNSIMVYSTGGNIRIYGAGSAVATLNYSKIV